MGDLGDPEALDTGSSRRARSLAWAVPTAAAVFVATVLVIPIDRRGRGLLLLEVLVLILLWVAVTRRLLRTADATDPGDVADLIDRVLPEEYLRATRRGDSVVVVAIDVDGDKPRVLRRHRESLEASVRRTDHVAPTYGGSTLLALLTVQTDVQEPCVVGRLVERLMSAGTTPQRIGVARYPNDLVSPDELVQLALDRRRLQSAQSAQSVQPAPGPSHAPRPTRGPRHRSSSLRLAKRSGDIVGAAVGLALVMPLLAVAAIAIRLETPGAVMFTQYRTGLNGRPFKLRKLRTMVCDAEMRLDEVAHLNDLEGGHFKARNDPRITRVGQVLRKLSIDELPQLWNVMRGDMALVGPRPTTVEPAGHEPWQLERLSVRPGLTGLWQVEGRGTSSFDDRCRLDIRYARDSSLHLDLRILVLTVPAVLSTRGAH
jgi:lipopolysaccharide/colanic/teichoic acid biosynthesis glycosyltransferase